MPTRESSIAGRAAKKKTSSTMVMLREWTNENEITALCGWLAHSAVLHGTTPENIEAPERLLKLWLGAASVCQLMAFFFVGSVPV